MTSEELERDVEAILALTKLQYGNFLNPKDIEKLKNSLMNSFRKYISENGMQASK